MLGITRLTVLFFHKTSMVAHDLVQVYSFSPTVRLSWTPLPDVQRHWLVVSGNGSVAAMNSSSVPLLIARPHDRIFQLMSKFGDPAEPWPGCTNLIPHYHHHYHHHHLPYNLTSFPQHALSHRGFKSLCLNAAIKGL